MNILTYKYDSLSLKLISNAQISSGNKTLAVKALWDTGATKTCIAKHVAIELDLHPVGEDTVFTPSGCAKFNQYIITVLLPSNVVFNDIEVSESEIAAEGIGLLIGMDIISTGDFAVSNFKRKTTFTFRIPSIEEIDFIEKKQIKKKVKGWHRKDIPRRYMI